MRQISLRATVAFLVGLGIGFVAWSVAVAAPGGHDALAADLAAIERLHKTDIEATLTQDPKGLMDLWTEDAVRFNPGGPSAVGKQAIGAENEKAHAQYPGLKVLSYVPQYTDIRIQGDLACEWFEREGEYRLSPESPSARWHAKGLDRATVRGNSR
jgi:ketosteroid isomerase-like protein